MKLKNIVLLGIVSSIMAYLNNNLEFSSDEESSDDSLFKDIKALVADKLAKADFEEKLKGLSENKAEDVDLAQKMAQEMTDDLLHDLDQTLDDYKALKDEATEDFNYDDLLSELEDLLAKMEVNQEEPIKTLAPFRVISDEERYKYDDKDSGVFKVEVKTEPKVEEDPYLAKIQEAINNSFYEQSEEAKDETKTEEKEVTADEIDDLFAKIMAEEDKDDQKEESEENYIDELVSELEGALGDLNELEKEDPKDVYTKISELYPYLSPSFIRAVYDMKEAISLEYPLNQKVIILHRLSFDDLDDLRQFTEIVLNHAYRVNVDERQGIVDILKEFVNTDGKILTNIFEIANQARLLHGEYEGYRVDIVA